jgi:hypothetical protein
MIKNLAEFVGNSRPSKKALHIEAGAVWEKSAEAALDHPEFAKKDRQLHSDLSMTLQESLFLTGSGQVMLQFALADPIDGRSYIMPTVDKKVYGRLAGSITGAPENGNLGGMFIPSRERKLGAVCLAPLEEFTDIERKIVILHELTHAGEHVFTGTADFIPTPLNASPVVRNRYLQANQELSAYESSAIVLDAGTEGLFGNYVEGVYAKTVASVIDADKPQVDLTPSSEHADLHDIAGVGPTALCSVLTRLYEERKVGAAEVVFTMVNAGVVN